MSFTTFIKLFVVGIFILLTQYIKVDQVNGDIFPNTIRKFPLCISHNDPVLDKDPNYKQFKDVIKNADTYLKPLNGPLKQLTTLTSPIQNPDPNPDLTIFDWIRFSRIKVNTAGKFPNKETLDPKEPLGKGLDFNQWIHVTVRTKKDIVGLIVQAMQAPIGIPFGNFGEFKDNDNKICSCMKSVNMYLNGLAIPCTYKPKGALTYPDVFMWHSKYKRTYKGGTYNGALTKEVHFHFKFIDIMCHRTSTFQFLLLAVTDFGDKSTNKEIVAEAVFTETYFKEQPHSLDGVPYPFHPDWCSIIDCGFKSSDIYLGTYLYTFITLPTTTSFKYSIEYDMCTQYGPTNEIDKQHKSCPPGPFFCETLPIAPTPQDMVKMEAAKINDLLKDPDPCVCKLKDIIEKIIPQTKPPGIIPPTKFPWIDSDVSESKKLDNPPTTTLEPDEPKTLRNFHSLTDSEKTTLEILASMAITDARIRSLHGMFMFFAFSIAGSILMFIARFDKDILPGVGCCAKGIWLWGHIICACSSLIMIWGGLIIFALTSGEDSQWIPTHVFFGVLAICLFHLDFCFGWIRPIGRSFRGLYISVHTICGYLSKLFAVLAMLITRVEQFPFNQTILIVELVNILFYAANSMVQRMTDYSMKIKSRRICPYAENKKLDKPVPTGCSILRNIILAIHFCIHVFIFIIAVNYWIDPRKLRSYYDIYLPGNYKNSNN